MPEWQWMAPLFMVTLMPQCFKESTIPPRIVRAEFNVLGSPMALTVNGAPYTLPFTVIVGPEQRISDVPIKR